YGPHRAIGQDDAGDERGARVVGGRGRTKTLELESGNARRLGVDDERAGQQDHDSKHKEASHDGVPLWHEGGRGAPHMPLSETLAQGLAKRVTYLCNDCMSKSIGKSKDFLRTRPAGNCSPPRGPHRSCDSALLSQHTTFEFHEGEPGHALHIACYPILVRSIYHSL